MVVLRLSCDRIVIVLWTAAQGEGSVGWIQRGMWQARPTRIGGVLQQVAHIGMLPSRWVGHAVVDFLALLGAGACCRNLRLACQHKSARVLECRSAAIWDFFWRGGLRDDPEDGTVDGQ